MLVGFVILRGGPGSRNGFDVKTSQRR